MRSCQWQWSEQRSKQRSGLQVARRVRAWLAVGVAGGLVACNDVQPVAPSAPPTTDATKLYMSLTVDYPAVNIATVAPYDTLRLTATPRDAHGQPMAGLPAATFTSSDTTKVKVTPDGLLQAVEEIAAPGVTVTASLTAGPVTHTAITTVQVTATAPTQQLASLSIHPIRPDSAIWSDAISTGGAVGFDKVILQSAGLLQNSVPDPRATDLAGNPISGLIYSDELLDSSIAKPLNKLASGLIGGMQLGNPGQVRRVVQTNAYGIAKTDTVTYTVTLPAFRQFTWNKDPDNGKFHFSMSSTSATVRIPPYGIVSFTITVSGDVGTGDSTDIVFDDTTNVKAAPAAACDLLTVYNGIFGLPTCSSGNGLVVSNFTSDPFFLGDMFILRQFPAPGAYTFHSTRTGLSGRIVVTTDPYGSD